jgi:hypothetical protein
LSVTGHYFWFKNEINAMKKENSENGSKITLAVILIVIGMIWLFGVLNIHFHLGEIFRPVWLVFSKLGGFIFSWPVILILVGLILMAGNRSGGWILIIIGGIFLLPKIFLFPAFPVSIVLPLALILFGGLLIIRRI